MRLKNSIVNKFLLNKKGKFWIQLPDIGLHLSKGIQESWENLVLLLIEDRIVLKCANVVIGSHTPIGGLIRGIDMQIIFFFEVLDHVKILLNFIEGINRFDLFFQDLSILFKSMRKLSINILIKWLRVEFHYLQLFPGFPKFLITSLLWIFFFIQNLVVIFKIRGQLKYMIGYFLLIYS